MRLRLEKSFDCCRCRRYAFDGDVALLARGLGIDVVVDLNGFTLGTDIFAMSSADSGEVSRLRNDGSSIDYLIADPILIQRIKNNISLKIVYLPNTFQVNDLKRHMPTKFTGPDAVCRTRVFVFCCFNNSYKLSREIFDIWMRLLMRVGVACASI
jgi:predicted O-linked N-acetylglucosamine transferase (SPINDLY family)